ncbi:MAG: DUF3047 domain-containing protein [Nitrospirae bacterium]|nr:DUF3047 domain-containing protein [Nitrospirota bacterium]
MTLNRRFLILSSLLLAIVPAPLSAGADGGETLPVGLFSEAAEGQPLPPEWRPLVFPKIPRHTEYALVRDGEITVVRAVSRAAASGLTREIRIDLREYPVIRWRWKVSNVVRKSDARRKEGDDYAARIYIAFMYEPDRLSLAKKAKYRIGRLLYGDLPIGALTYIWESRAPVGTLVDNAYTGFVKMIVVESGDRNTGRWITEERNVYDDYRRAFVEEPPPVSGVAIMTDTDNTGESAVAYYGDIVFMKK